MQFCYLISWKGSKVCEAYCYVCVVKLSITYCIKTRKWLSEQNRISFVSSSSKQESIPFSDYIISELRFLVLCTNLSITYGFYSRSTGGHICLPATEFWTFHNMRGISHSCCIGKKVCSLWSQAGCYYYILVSSGVSVLLMCELHFTSLLSFFFWSPALFKISANCLFSKVL